MPKWTRCLPRLRRIDPLRRNTDCGGVDDGTEIEYGPDPLDPGDDRGFGDADGDGLKKGDEVKFGSDPFNPDSDMGGLDDSDEYWHGRDPHDPSDDLIGAIIIDGEAILPAPAVFSD